MITSLVLAVQFLIGIAKRLASDAYYRTLGVLVAIVLVIGTLFVWLVGGGPSSTRCSTPWRPCR